MQNISTTFTGMRYCAHERKHVASVDRRGQQKAAQLIINFN